MVASGVLDGEPVELVDGLLVHVTPQGSEHAALVQWLTRQLGARLDLLRVRMPLAVPGGRPEPDVALAETTTSRERLHTAALVVEVAVTSQADDLAKLRGYATPGSRGVADRCPRSHRTGLHRSARPRVQDRARPARR